MYGINPASVSDTYKATAFKSLMGESAEIYYNEGSLAKCFDVFADSKHTPDAVICANIYAAVSLMKKIGDSMDISVTSLGGGLLSEFTKTNITRIESDYRSFAAAGIELARILVKNECISSLTACVKGRFKPGESTNGIPHRENGAFRECVDTRGDIRFYSDKDVQEMLRIEQMLSQLGDGDYEMLSDILDGKTYQYIAEKRFCSEGTVKYKMKHLYDICGVKGRLEFVELIDKYI
jgi:DNA-binding CsgD family transcriptional regulator